MTILFEHARKLDAHGQIDDFWMLVDGDTILSTGSGAGPDAASRVDVAGRWLVPGFIDLHCHGGGGFSFDAGEFDGLHVHREHGTTRSLVSLVAAPVDVLASRLSAVAELTARDPLVLGSHLEGPFLSPAFSGAHDQLSLLEPQPSIIEKLLNAAHGTLRQITIAPELPGAFEAIDVLVEADVAVAVGHTAADFELTQRAFASGARLLTHVFNAMPGIHHREPGPVVAAFENGRITIELILDGIHVHPDVARLVFAAAPGRVALVTDAMAGAGAGDGEYVLGGLSVSVIEGRAVITGTGQMAGSTLTLDRALRAAISDVGIHPQAAVEAVTLAPAHALGLDDRLGLLAPGFAADAVLLDHRWAVGSVWAAGQALS
jgi:N-acetylglucosamine-6-phosphate deacetylase